MRPIAPGTSVVDLNFQGQAQYIACYVLQTSGGLALVDPGPTSCLDSLRAGLDAGGFSLGDVTDLLLTHIHLDHAGATGTIVRHNPAIRVHVHARGARHMAAPERLLASATRLYGERMDTLWGEFAAVPQERIHVLEGGETLTLGSRQLEVAYTPGHASHHVSYFEAANGHAYVGDTLGIRIDNRPFVLPVTPPPDIHLELWAESHARIRAWQPDVVCPTHFGPASPAADHIDEHEQRLREWAERVQRDLEAERDPATAIAAFQEAVSGEIIDRMGTEVSDTYLTGGGMHDSWHGLARYFAKRAESAS